MTHHHFPLHEPLLIITHHHFSLLEPLLIMTHHHFPLRRVSAMSECDECDAISEDDVLVR
jgi:hypothetical protein